MNIFNCESASNVLLSVETIFRAWRSSAVALAIWPEASKALPNNSDSHLPVIATRFCKLTTSLSGLLDDLFATDNTRYCHYIFVSLSPNGSHTGFLDIINQTPNELNELGAQSRNCLDTPLQSRPNKRTITGRKRRTTARFAKRRLRKYTIRVISIIGQDSIWQVTITINHSTISTGITRNIENRLTRHTGHPIHINSRCQHGHHETIVSFWTFHRHKSLTRVATYSTLRKIKRNEIFWTPCGSTVHLRYRVKRKRSMHRIYTHLSGSLLKPEMTEDLDQSGRQSKPHVACNIVKCYDLIW